MAEERAAFELVLAGKAERVKSRAQRGVERLVRGCEDARRRRREIGEHRVDPVEAGARHEPDEKRLAHSRSAKLLLTSRSSRAARGSARSRKACSSGCGTGRPAGIAMEFGLRASPATRNS